MTSRLMLCDAAEVDEAGGMLFPVTLFAAMGSMPCHWPAMLLLILGRRHAHAGYCPVSKPVQWHAPSHTRSLMTGTVRQLMATKVLPSRGIAMWRFQKNWGSAAAQAGLLAWLELS